jgi:hypothetical protein
MSDITCQVSYYSYLLNYFYVNYLWMEVNKIKVLILHHGIKIFFPQINSPSSSK